MIEYACDCHESGKPLEGTTGHTSLCNRLSRKKEKERLNRKNKVMTALRKVSPKMAAKMSEYMRRKKEFIKGKGCPIYPNFKVVDIHHKAGRSNELLMDERYWLAVSRKGHIKIELNPDWAKKMGYSLSRHEKLTEREKSDYEQNTLT